MGKRKDGSLPVVFRFSPLGKTHLQSGKTSGRVTSDEGVYFLGKVNWYERKLYWGQTCRLCVVKTYGSAKVAPVWDVPWRRMIVCLPVYQLWCYNTAVLKVENSIVLQLVIHENNSLFHDPCPEV